MSARRDASRRSDPGFDEGVNETGAPLAVQGKKEKEKEKSWILGETISPSLFC